MDDRDLLAAELALRLLEGDDRREAERRLASDPDLQDRVAAWDERLAPLLDEVAEEEPDEAVWTTIRSRLSAAPASNVVALKRRMNMWRGYSAAISALAASLAFIVWNGSNEAAPIEQAAPQPMLAAAIAPEQGGVSITIAVDPDRRHMLVTRAGIAAVPGHDHELWIVPETGAPVSLGLLSQVSSRRVAVPANQLSALHENVVLAISAEPAGGSQTGKPTGPIVATGKLLPV